VDLPISQLALRRRSLVGCFLRLVTEPASVWVLPSDSLAAESGTVAGIDAATLFEQRHIDRGSSP